MKNHFLRTLAGLALIASTFTGCDLFDKADDVKLDTTLPLEFLVNEQAVNPGGKQYASTKTLNALDNADVAKYKDKIKEIKLNRITYIISDYSGTSSVTFTNGSLNAVSKTLATATSVNLQSSAETELTNIDQAGFDEFAKQIKANKQVDVTVAGTLSATPVAFKITAYFEVT